nr:MAG: hypothetical protein [Helarchaeota virus Nidhogg Meg22_1214]
MSSGNIIKLIQLIITMTKTDMKKIVYEKLCENCDKCDDCDGADFNSFFSLRKMIYAIFNVEILLTCIGKELILKYLSDINLMVDYNVKDISK